jgi:hypothetical protein
MSATPQVTNPSAFSKQSLGIQVVLTIVTLGLYPLYWTYKTAKQLDAGTNQSLMPILGIIPVLNLVAFWQVSSAAEAVTNQSKVIIFILFLVFGPISWYWVQSGINAHAPN